MRNVLTILLIISLAATAITLVLGMSTMFRKNNPENEQRSNSLMRLRVILQGLTLLIFALLLIS